jgi:hypothetical protein
MNIARTEITAFSNKFEVIINTDCLNSIKNLNIGNHVKKALTKEMASLTGDFSLNISKYKHKQDLINTQLDAKNPRVDVYLGSGKKKVLYLNIQYIGIQEKRDKKIKELMSDKK